MDRFYQSESVDCCVSEIPDSVTEESGSSDGAAISSVPAVNVICASAADAGKFGTGIVLAMDSPLSGKRYSSVRRIVMAQQRTANIIIPTGLSNRAPGRMMSRTRPEAFTMPWSMMLAQMERIR